MTREELLKTTHLADSGNLTIRLEELESCGFLRKYRQYGMKERNAVYQLIDNFTLFYYKFDGKERKRQYGAQSMPEMRAGNIR